MTDKEQNPVDQLIDLFVYAPVGLLYEYQEVIPRLVRRGKSQVQLARVVGKMATSRGGGGEAITMVAEGVANVISRQLTDIGEAIGLAPTDDEDATRPGPDLRLVPEAPADEPDDIEDAVLDDGSEDEDAVEGEAL
ncbi:MAG: hypothetical protein AAF547_17520 [Actinomycetota bacterium]